MGNFRREPKAFLCHENEKQPHKDQDSEHPNKKSATNSMESKGTI